MSGMAVVTCKCGDILIIGTGKQVYHFSKEEALDLAVILVREADGRLLQSVDCTTPLPTVTVNQTSRFIQKYLGKKE